ncbi:MAG: VWA domain-containing protein, partial [Candidatus Eremiobacteraeota bacterium]|nr:VWA domain-containing protein [Candidatus Eremiobacteraeota bacterium]
MKVARFAAVGALGALLAALLAELVLVFALPKVSPPPALTKRVDLVFVLDVTGSMVDELDGVKASIDNFVARFDRHRLDVRVGLLAFGDAFAGEEVQAIKVGGDFFTRDIDGFRNGLSKLGVVSGEDPPESSLDALVAASRLPFAREAVKVVILITDAPPHVPDRETPSLEAARLALRSVPIDRLHLVVPTSLSAFFTPLQAEVGGELYPLPEDGALAGFDRALPEIGESIAKELSTGSPIQSKAEVPLHQFGRLLAATSLWTGMLAAGIGLALVFAQSRYQRRQVSLAKGLVGLVGGLAVGFTSGAAGQVLYGGAAIIPALIPIGRVLAWTLLGALLGLGMALFVPNLAPRPALAGGAVGGALGAIAFLTIGNTAGDLAARLAGAAILGLLIGMMVVLAETMCRKAWLEVIYADDQGVAVNLGSTAVAIGSDASRCDLPVQGASPLA